MKLYRTQRCELQKVMDFALYRIAERVVRNVIRSFPPRIRERVEGVEFVIVREPHNAEDQEMLGVFEGASLMDDGADCPRITIFYMNVWRYARYRLHRYRREVERTVYHEVGHFLGWDEEDLRKRDLD